jgi:hypothetical protein
MMLPAGNATLRPDRGGMQYNNDLGRSYCQYPGACAFVSALLASYFHCVPHAEPLALLRPSMQAAPAAQVDLIYCTEMRNS